MRTKETKLGEFQFKLLHRRIVTNDFRYFVAKIFGDDSSIKNSLILATFASGEATENLVHLF